MTREHLRELLGRFERGELSADELQERLVRLPFRDLGDVRVDTLRELRQGASEVVLGCGKSAEQIAAIAGAMGPGDGNLLVTRVSAELAEQVRALEPELTWHPKARCLVLQREPIAMRGRGFVALVTAGTSDIPVAEEAALAAELHGSKVERIYDVGVAGLQRVLASLDLLRAANVVIVVAGMDGALPSVVGGLVERPVIAVPTSVGYGASFAGLAALLGMLNSCASTVSVVNIDNGFGAGFVAARINA